MRRCSDGRARHRRCAWAVGIVSDFAEPVLGVDLNRWSDLLEADPAAILHVQKMEDHPVTELDLSAGCITSFP